MCEASDDAAVDPGKSEQLGLRLLVICWSIFNTVAAVVFVVTLATA